MRRLLWGLILLAAASSSTAGAVELYQAGRDYIELPIRQSVETGDKIELREFFWYGCPHCYALEPALSAYVKKLPANVRFIRTPGAAQRWLIHAQAYYAFEALGLTGKLHIPFFDALHKQNRQLDTEAAIVDFVAEQGVDKATFRETFNSFAVRTRVERAKQDNVGFMVDGVPMLAVDGRYLTSPQLAHGEASALKVVDFLIQKAAGERKKSAALH